MSFYTTIGTCADAYSGPRQTSKMKQKYLTDERAFSS